MAKKISIMRKNIVFGILLLLTLSSCKDDVVPKKEKPISDFSFRVSGQFAPAKVTFYNESSNATKYIWDFGDGSAKSYKSSPTHTYYKGGVYTVGLTSIGDGGRNYISKTVNIPNEKKPDSDPKPKPIPNFSFTINGKYAPIKVNFANETVNATQYIWDFGDGSSKSYKKSPTHTYSKGGIYTITLTAMGNGYRNHISKTINIPNAPTKMQINTINIISYPKLDTDGTSWDYTNGPDIYWRITNEITENTVKGKIIRNVTNSDLPLIFDSVNLPYIINDIKERHSVSIYDDDDYGQDDPMGGYYFTPFSYTDYPSYINLYNYGNELSIILSVTWKE